MKKGTFSTKLVIIHLMIPILIHSEIPDHLDGLGIPFIKSSKGIPTYLEFKDDKLSLITESMKKEGQKPIFFDFIKIWNRLDPADKRGPLFKAIGPSLKKGPIWDLTCGMGGDSLLMLFFGAEVVGFERNITIGALLMDAYKRALGHPKLGPIIADRFTLLIQDAREASMEPPLIIYFDPMYEGGKRKSLQKKEMRVFREVVGEDEDAKEVLKWALKYSQERVVVKRSLRAEPILPDPTFSHKGKSTRYDLYKVT
jgi:16S rRNA (guanine1516-N2)-methyltransferase